MSKPQIRVAVRALLVAVTSFGVQLQQSATWDSALLRSAVVGAVLAALEVFTPLNALVGPDKNAAIVAVIPPPTTPPPVKP